MRIGTMGRVTMAAMAVACGAAAAPTITVSDVQQKFTEGDYAGAIAGSGRLLAATGSAATPVDKAQVYAIKADAHLHLKQFSQAADAYTRAAKAATNPATLATDTAMALLIKKSHSGAYVPKKVAADGAKPSPIDITSSTDRKTALTALFEDEFATGDPRLKAAATSTSIAAIQPAADLATTLRSLEIAATDADEKTKPEIDANVSHAHDLLDAPLKTMSQQVDKIKAAADAPPRYGRNVATGGAAGAGGAAPTPMKTGLTQQERSDLQNVIANAQKIGMAADGLAKSTDESKGLLAKASTTTATAGDVTPAADATAAAGGSPLDAVSTEAKKLVTDAEEVLNANYGHPGAMGGGGNSGYGRGTRTGR